MTALNIGAVAFLLHAMVASIDGVYFHLWKYKRHTHDSSPRPDDLGVGSGSQYGSEKLQSLACCPSSIRLGVFLGGEGAGSAGHGLQARWLSLGVAR